MPFDFKSLKKLETLPPSAQSGELEDDRRLLVLLKVRESRSPPAYVTPRAQMGPQIFSAEIKASDLKTLESDPDVESVSISKKLPLIE
jgi:hypothetical protein